MRLKLTAILLLSVLLPLHAYEPVEHENILKVKYGFVNQLDPYLSPLSYHGQQIGIGNEWWQSFHRDSAWAHIGRLDINGLRAYNTAGSNLIYGLGIYAGWGAYYHWNWFDNRLKVFLGPYLEANFMAREIGNNVNKPFSFDAGIDVMAMTGISWSFYGRKTSYRLRYLIRTNLIGVLAIILRNCRRSTRNSSMCRTLESQHRSPRTNCRLPIPSFHLAIGSRAYLP